MIGFTYSLVVTLAGASFATPAANLNEDQKIVHVLNRLGYGPRPGDVERVKQIGLKSYIEQQLKPEEIKDEATDTKTSRFASLKLSGMEIAEMERQVQMSNQQLQRIRRQMEVRGAMDGANAINGAVNNAVAGTTPPPAQQARQAMDVLRNATPEERAMLEEGRMARQRVNEAGVHLIMNKLVRAAESEKQLYEVLVDFWSNHFNIDATKVRASKVVDEQQVIRPHVMGKFRDLLHASATSAAMMLYLDNAQSVAPQAPQRRPGALRRQQQPPPTLERLRAGSRQGIPVAVQVYARVQEIAKAENISEDDAYKRIQALQAAPGRRAAGLNENYARELMELHTLGVDGGYTQKDVTEVARVLTGWGVRGGRYSGEFEFHPNLHDQEEKVVLGTTIPAGGGIQEGKAVLDMLAAHPSTMRHISTKLCRRFVSDNPPKSLVDRCVETWKRTDGDIREIMRCIATSREFFSADAFKKKIKSPFEYVVSSVRALGATVEAEPLTDRLGGFRRPNPGGLNVFAPNGNGQINTYLIAGQIGTLGQPLFNYGFPTGYPEESTKWVSSGALISRINFALSLVNGRINDVNLGSGLLSDESLKRKPLPEMIDKISKSLLGSPLSSSTRSTLLKQLSVKNSATITEGSSTSSSVNNQDISDDSQDETRRVAALVLGAPEFQRR